MIDGTGAEPNRAWLFGDSIFKGQALGRYPDAFTPEEIAAEPLWPLRSPAATMNLLLGEDVVEYVGRTGQPDNTGAAIKELRALLETRIEDGDAVVFLDVGTHPCDPDRSERQWLALRDAATAERQISLFMCTGFDNAGVKAVVPGQPAPALFMHELRFGERSHNDAVRAAAVAAGQRCGTTRLVELAGEIADIHHAMQAIGGSAYRDDQIHLSVWGQTVLSVALCRSIWPQRTLHLTSALHILRRSTAATTNFERMAALLEPSS